VNFVVDANLSPLAGQDRHAGAMTRCSREAQVPFSDGPHKWDLLAVFRLAADTNREGELPGVPSRRNGENRPAIDAGGWAMMSG